MHNIKNLFVHNLSLKIISLFLAIILWFYVAGEQKEEIERRASLNIEPPAGMVIITRSTDKVDVLLRGPKNRLSLLPSDLRIYYKIEGIEKAGEYSFTLSAQNIEVPSGVKVVSIKPSTIRVSLDRLIRKWLPIKPDIQGRVGEGYRIVKKKIKLNPNICLVEGPEKVLKNLKYVYTSPVKVTGYTKSFTRRVSLRPLAKGHPSSSEIIEVSIPIERDLVNKEFKDVPLKFLLSSFNFFFKTSTKSVNITLTGPREDLERMKKSDIIAFVDLSELNPGRYKLPVHIKLPVQISLLSEVPLIEVEVKDISEWKEKQNVFSPSLKE
ncbi:MAG: hypothetical protein DRP75_00560 [Candidatus Omnitrophota bacterium]|nr:MAG: hypothetical protein DRP75_00560 [Candidatus Omnitrophota bacterium]